MELYDRGLCLKALRRKRGLSQQEAASRLGITRSTVSAYERNIKSPSLEILEKMAILYHASIDYMLGMESRTNLYIDDLSESQQKTVVDIVDRLREEFKKD